MINESDLLNPNLYTDNPLADAKAITNMLRLEMLSEEDFIYTCMRSHYEGGVLESMLNPETMIHDLYYAVFFAFYGIYKETYEYRYTLFNISGSTEESIRYWEGFFAIPHENTLGLNARIETVLQLKNPRVMTANNAQAYFNSIGLSGITPYNYAEQSPVENGDPIYDNAIITKNGSDYLLFAIDKNSQSMNSIFTDYNNQILFYEKYISAIEAVIGEGEFMISASDGRFNLAYFLAHKFHLDDWIIDTNAKTVNTTNNTQYGYVNLINDVITMCVALNRFNNNGSFDLTFQLNGVAVPVYEPLGENRIYLFIEVANLFIDIAIGNGETIFYDQTGVRYDIGFIYDSGGLSGELKDSVIPLVVIQWNKYCNQIENYCRVVNAMNTPQPTCIVFDKTNQLIYTILNKSFNVEIESSFISNTNTLNVVLYSNNNADIAYHAPFFEIFKQTFYFGVQITTIVVTITPII